MLCATHQTFRHGLIDGLFEDLSNTISIRGKQDRCAVGRPEDGMFSFSSSVSRLFARIRVPSAADGSMYTLGNQFPRRKITPFPSGLPLTCEIQPWPPEMRFGAEEMFFDCRSETTHRLASCCCWADPNA